MKPFARPFARPKGLCAAPCQWQCQCPSLGARTGERERAVPGTGLSQANAATRRLCAALCQWQGQCSSFGARTGRALQDCSALSRWRSDCFAIRCGAGAQAAQPMAERTRHWLSRQWHPIGLAFGLCARSFAVRAPCAHQRKSNASHKAKRFQKRAGQRQGPKKDCENR